MHYSVSVRRRLTCEHECRLARPRLPVRHDGPVDAFQTLRDRLPRQELEDGLDSAIAGSGSTSDGLDEDEDEGEAEEESEEEE